MSEATYFRRVGGGILRFGKSVGEALTCLTCVGIFLVLIGLQQIGAQDYEYTIQNEEVTITRYVGSGGDVVIPETIEGLVVNGIKEFAFYGDADLTNVSIPASVTNIGTAAFGFCTNLARITVDENNTHYSDLDGVLFDKTHTTILQFPAGQSGAYTIADGVIFLGEKAFIGSPWLTRVVVPDSVVDVGKHTFYGCVGLVSVSFGSGVTNIGERAFVGCTSLKKVSLPDSVSNIETGAFSYCGCLEEVTMGNRVNRIGDQAFRYCGELRSVVLPDSLTSIGTGAFSYCWSLLGVSIPESVSSMGDAPFEDCKRLDAIAVSELNTNYSSLDGVLFDKTQTKLIQYPAGKAGDYSVPETVVALGNSSFFGATELSGITIPDTIASIGKLAFGYCSNLSSVSLPNQITSIQALTFTHCGNLTRVDLPDSVVYIRALAFSHCANLSYIDIPKSTYLIGNNAFQYCGNLTRARIGESAISIGNYAFRNCENLTAVYFEGNAPSVDRGTEFEESERVVVFYLPNATGWDSAFADRPTAIWKPRLIPSTNINGQAQFNIDWAKSYTVDVESADSVTAPNWITVDSVTLSDGQGQFTAPVGQLNMYFRLKWVK